MTPPATPSPPQDETSPDSRDGGPLPLWRIGSAWPRLSRLSHLPLNLLRPASFTIIPKLSKSSLPSPNNPSTPARPPSSTLPTPVSTPSSPAAATWVDADPAGETWDSVHLLEHLHRCARAIGVPGLTTPAAPSFPHRPHPSRKCPRSGRINRGPPPSNGNGLLTIDRVLRRRRVRRRCRHTGALT